MVMPLVVLRRDGDRAAGGLALAGLTCVCEDQSLITIERGGGLLCLQLHYTFFIFGGCSVAYVSVAISLFILMRLACI